MLAICAPKASPRAANLSGIWIVCTTLIMGTGSKTFADGSTIDNSAAVSKGPFTILPGQQFTFHAVFCTVFAYFST